VLSGAWVQKPPLTLDDFFSSIEIRSLQISPDGHEVVVETVRRDFPNNRYRSDLWLYRDSGAGSLVQLTRSGHDSGPQWSPDGLSVAFISDRESTAADSTDTGHGATETAKNAVARVYVVSSQGGESFPINSNDLEIHAFAWSANSHWIYFAARDELTNEQNDAYRGEWKDVIQYRESERGDTVFGVEVASAESRNITKLSRMTRSTKPSKISTVPYRIDQMAASPDGNFLALATSSRSGRLESIVQRWSACEYCKRVKFCVT
jgi:dipeptidyl aminopeptidase/acylaminoacyl peptidase